MTPVALDQELLERFTDVMMEKVLLLPSREESQAVSIEGSLRDLVQMVIVDTWMTADGSIPLETWFQDQESLDLPSGNPPIPESRDS